jgi:alpha-tubulin suppressor-like RCC1 family protein
MRRNMLARPRVLLAVAAFALSALAAAPAGASQSLDCKPAGRGLLSCWDGKLTLRTAGLPGARLLAAASSLDARDVVVAHDRACALMPDGGLECWGDNESGELGDGTRTRRDAPVRVRDLADVTAVALGNSLTCALRGSGKVACWGYDDVTRAHRLRPSVIPSLDHVAEIVVGGDQACARRQDGSVWCWGNNHYGQLGDGTRKDRRRPVRVATLTHAVELSAGLSHVCARRQDGSVWCWGNGWGGTDGTDDRLLTPARVPAIHDATVLISVEGDSRSGFAALQKDGSLVSCHYQVGNASESSPRLLCHADKAPPAKALGGTQLLIRRPQVRRPPVASAARAPLPRSHRHPGKPPRP